jgi:hypothetical protein
VSVHQNFSSKIGRLLDGHVRDEWNAWSGCEGRLARGRALTLAARGELGGFGRVGAQWPIVS